MSVQHIPPKPTGNSWINWAQRLGAYLQQTRSILRHKLTGESAKDNGIILWDEANGYPVVSKNNVYRQIVLADGHATFVVTTDVTAAAINTAYPITWNSTLISDGISLGTPASRIVVDEAGFYLITFTVQITSNSSNSKMLKFWPKLNGVNVPNYTINVSVSSNGDTIAMTRDALMSLSAGDYIEAYWATNDTDVALEAVAATAYSPAGASVLVSMMRIRQQCYAN